MQSDYSILFYIKKNEPKKKRFVLRHGPYHD